MAISTSSISILPFVISTTPKSDNDNVDFPLPDLPQIPIYNIYTLKIAHYCVYRTLFIWILLYGHELFINAVYYHPVANIVNRNNVIGHFLMGIATLY